jgi:hypothetical protein
MSDKLSEVLVVRDGKNLVELRTFEDVRKFLSPRETAPVGIARVLCLAHTTEQKLIAVRSFVEWARKAGVLVEMHTA